MRRRDIIALLGGSLIAQPFAARAQQKPVPVIGFLLPSSRAYSAPYVAAFYEGLNEFGYIEGKNIACEYRWAEGHYDQMPAMAAELLGSKVDLIVTAGTSGMKAAHSLTTTVPIIFFGGDVVAAGIVTSLARPGGNLTGISIMGDEMMPKRLDLLYQLVSQTKVI